MSFTAMVVLVLLFSVNEISAKKPKTKNNKTQESTDNAELSKDFGNLLETFGYQAATNVYVVYISIGTLADSFGKQVYDASTVIQLTSEHSGLIKGNMKQLQLLLNSKIFSQEDKKMLEEVRSIYSVLLLQSNGLKNLASTGQEKYLTQYSEARKTAWKKISSLLNIDSK